MFDHFYPVDGDGSCFEVMTALAALTPLVPGHQVGHLVLANPYRHPTLVAKSAATIDHISGGNFVLGLGAGWHVPETTAYGIPLDPVGTATARPALRDPGHPGAAQARGWHMADRRQRLIERRAACPSTRRRTADPCPQRPLARSG